MINKKFLIGISSFAVVAASSFASPILAKSNEILWDQPQTVGMKALSHVGNAVNNKINKKIDEISQRAGVMAAQKVIDSIYTVKGIHGVTQSGERVTIVNDNSTLVRGLITKFTDIDLNSALAPNIPGGKAMTTFVLNKLENYLMQNMISEATQQLIAKSTAALVHKAVSQLKESGSNYLSDQSDPSASVEVDSDDNFPFLSLSNLEENNNSDMNLSIGGRDVVDYYLAKIRIGISDEIRQVVNAQVNWAVDAIEEKGITLGYGISATGTVMALTAINPLLGIAASGAVYLDSNLELGGRELVHSALNSRTNLPEVKRKLANYVTAQEVPFLPSLLAVTEKDNYNFHHRGVEITESEGEFEDWVALDVVSDKRATLHNYITQKTEDARKQLEAFKNKASDKLQSANKVISGIREKTTASSVFGWGTSVAKNTAVSYVSQMNGMLSSMFRLY